jgi:enoyl-CoA hydratase/carnithine racemase
MHFDDYRERFASVHMERRNRVLEMRLHTRGGPLQWTYEGGAQTDLAGAFEMVAADAENRVIILTGTGDVFCGPPATYANVPTGGPEQWEKVRENGVRLLTGLLDIPVPIIACLNGPAYRHAELALLGDVVLASEHAFIQDTAHFVNGLVPGDGVQLVLQTLLGVARTRHYLLTGQRLDARALLHTGVVGEVMPGDRLLPRAWELAEIFAARDPLVLRYTRRLLVEPVRRVVRDGLSEGWALEALAAVAAVKTPVAK